MGDIKRDEPWRASVLTLYPDMFPGPLGHALSGRALRDGLWQMDAINIRDFAEDKHRSVDDTPAGGGNGMVLRADILGRAFDAHSDERPRLFMTPRGRPLTQARVHDLASGHGALILCGRFEGVDERVISAYDCEEISIGDYVLSGGEMAAMVLIDAVLRLLPGVMGAQASADEESFENGLLEYPHYTRPAEWKGMKIPDVLTSGDHQKMAAWRLQESKNITRERRPDLWQKYQEQRMSDDDKKAR